MSEPAVALLQIFGAAFDAFDARSEARSEAKALARSAQQAQRIGDQRLADFTRGASALQGFARAARGASGIAMTGSPLIVDEATVRQVVGGQERIRRDTSEEVRELIRQRSRVKKRGSFTRNFVSGVFSSGAIGGLFG